MTLSELSGCVFSIAGAAAGGAIGLSQFGWVGALVGAPVGFFVGWLGGGGIVEAGFFIGTIRERMQKHRGLRKTFGRYWSRARVREWDALPDDLSVGEAVSGKVVRKYNYGVFIDIGRGFPALLSSLRYDRDISPLVGETVSARIMKLNSEERYIELTQAPEGDEAASNKTIEGD